MNDNAGAPGNTIMIMIIIGSLFFVFGFALTIFTMITEGPLSIWFIAFMGLGNALLWPAYGILIPFYAYIVLFAASGSRIRILQPDASQ